LETKEIDRGASPGVLTRGATKYLAPRKIKKVVIRLSKRLKNGISSNSD